MTDAIQRELLDLQRRAHAATERIAEVEGQLEHMTRLVAPLLVHGSMVRHYDRVLAEVDARLTQLEER